MDMNLHDKEVKPSNVEEEFKKCEDSDSIINTEVVGINKCDNCEQPIEGISASY